jgi:hypothetical protein
MSGYLEKLEGLSGPTATGGGVGTPVRGNAVNAVSPPWDQAQADGTLDAIESRLSRAVTIRGEANTDARKRVVEIYRGLGRRYHREHSPLLWEMVVVVERLLAEWRQPQPAQPKKR